jgi:transcriptional regulator with XRE-family HTH domain
VDKEQAEIETLSDYVRRVRNDKKLSLLDVEKNSKEAGTPIAGSYVSRIENEIADAVTPKKLQALANGLEVPEMELINVALGRKAPTDQLAQESQKLINYFAELPRDCQLDVLALTEALWRRRKIAKKHPPLKDSAREVAKPKALPDDERRVG